MAQKSELDIIDCLVNMYMDSVEIKHLGILCKKASYNNEQVLSYIKKMREKYNI